MEGFAYTPDIRFLDSITARLPDDDSYKITLQLDPRLFKHVPSRGLKAAVLAELTPDIDRLVAKIAAAKGEK